MRRLQAKTRDEIRLFRLTPKTIFYMLTAAGSTLLAVVAQVALSRVFDMVAAPGATKEGLIQYLLMLGGIFLLSLICNALFTRYLPMFFELDRARTLAISVMDDMLDMPVQAFRKQDQGYYYNQWCNGSFSTSALTGQVSIALGSNLLSLLILLYVTYRIQPLLALCVILYAPIVGLVMYWPTKKEADMQKYVLSHQDKGLGAAKTAIERKVPITMARAQGFFLKRFVMTVDPWMKALIRWKSWGILTATLPNAAMTLFKLVLLGVAVVSYFDGNMTAGTLVLTYQLAGLVQEPLASLFSSWAYIRSNKPFVQRLAELCDLVEEPSGFEGKFTPSAHLASFEEAKLYANGEKERLLFAAPHMTLPQKGLVVIKGANGSGKSMLVNYLTGFGDASAFEGKSELNENLQKASYLTYPLLLTKGSFTDNLFGKGYDQEVAQMLGIDFFEKEIDDEKVNLSFGEGQKLNLLRVLSSPSPVLVLDEPFTNLDKETIARLTDYLIEQKEHKAIIAITHSPELDTDADAIYAIRDGQLVCEK